MASIRTWFVVLFLLGVILTKTNGDRPFTTKKLHVSDRSIGQFTTTDESLKHGDASVRKTVKDWLKSGLHALIKSCKTVNLAMTGSALHLAKRLYDFYRFVQPNSSYQFMIEGLKRQERKSTPKTTEQAPHFNWNDSGLFEYDIRLHPRTRGVVFGGVKPNVQYSKTKFKNSLWPNGVIHYTYDNTIKNERSGLTLKLIEKSIELFEKLTCVRFIKQNWETAHIQFVKLNGCWSTVGRTGGMQQLSVGEGCENIGVIVHEMMHAIGFWHEQSRPDRDKYVKIMYENIEDGMEKQFKVYRDRTDSINSPYDYSSIMHYGPKYFSKNGKDTIVVRDKTFKGVLGQRTRLSTIDVDQINKLYKCSAVMDGQWSSWSSWSTCPVTCGGGESSRHRTCNNPLPRNGGKDCKGSSKSSKVCNIASCVLNSDCDFEGGLCKYRNIGGEGFNWIRRNRNTPSAYTGPHGGRKSIKDHYLYIETSDPAKPGQKARLRSDTIPFARRDQCLVFYYHMFGRDIDTLNVYIETEGEVRLHWSLKGNQGNSWQRGKIPIRRGYGEFKLIFEAFRGSSYRGDIAIDDIVMKRKPCSIKPINAIPDSMRKKYAKYACDFEETSPQCTWGNIVTYDTMDWSLIQGSTPSKQTGPSADTPKVLGKSYVYLEASKPAIMGDKAWLYSTVLPRVNKYREKCFHFSYHMYGNGMGTLSVFVHDKATSTLKKIWSLRGNQGNEWRKAQIQIPHGRSLNLLVEGERGSSYQSDMAFDNLLIDDGICDIEPKKARVVEITHQSIVTRDEEYPASLVTIEATSEGCGDPAVEDRFVQNLLSKNARSISPEQYEIMKLLALKNRKTKQPTVQTNTINDIPDLVTKTEKLTRNNAEEQIQKVSQIETDCSLARSVIKVNGEEMEAVSMGPGYHVVALTRQGKPILRQHYNTVVDPYALEYLIKDIRKLPDNSIIVIVTQNAVGKSPSHIQIQLQQFGAEAPFIPSKDGSWAFIGYKGKLKVNWIQQDTHPKGLGPSRVSVRIPKREDISGTEMKWRHDLQFDLIGKEEHFNGKYVHNLPMYAKEINLGTTEYTIRLCFKATGSGTLFSKVAPSVEDYDSKIKTAFIKDHSLHLKLHSGPAIILPNIVKYNVWNSLVIVNKKAWRYFELSAFMNGKKEISNKYKPEPDMTDSVFRLGKTVDNYPDKTYLHGSIKNMDYTTRPYELNEVLKSGC